MYLNHPVYFVALYYVSTEYKLWNAVLIYASTLLRKPRKINKQGLLNPINYLYNWNT